MPIRRFVAVLTLPIVGALSATAEAQPVGTFRWQQQPYCNVLTVNVVQTGSVYQLDGFDDQCGASTSASVVGLAFLNPNGTIGIGLTIVTTPGATPLHLDATLNWPSVNGTWRDSAGATGPFVLTPGAPLAGSARPVPKPSFPAGLTVGGGTITNVAAPVADTDAANKAYVDATRAATRQAMLNDKVWSALVSSTGAKSTTGPFTSSRSAVGSYNVTFQLTAFAVPYLDFFNYTVTPRCAGASANVTGRSSVSSTSTISQSASITVTDAAGAALDCAFFVMGVSSDPDAGSPVLPLAARDARPGVACSSDGELTTCVEHK